MVLAGGILEFSHELFGCRIVAPQYSAMATTYSKLTSHACGRSYYHDVGNPTVSVARTSTLLPPVPVPPTYLAQDLSTIFSSIEHATPCALPSSLPPPNSPAALCLQGGIYYDFCLYPAFDDARPQFVFLNVFSPNGLCLPSAHPGRMVDQLWFPRKGT